MRRTGIAVIVSGIIIAAAAIAWSPVAVPQLVKFPLNTNVSLKYTGSFVTYVNAKTGATLAKPTSVALTVDRTVKALPTSSSSVAMVREDLVSHFSGNTVSETNLYAINRRSMDNVVNSAAYALVPGGSKPVPGSYYVTLPMNLKTGSQGTTGLRAFKPETGTAYSLTPVSSASLPTTLNGVHVVWFRGVLPMTPVSPAEAAALAKQGLPTTLSPTAVEAQLNAAGISVSRLETALLPKLTSSQLSQLTSVLSTPIHLTYYAYGSGFLAAEPKTGTIVEAKSVIDGRAVLPDMTGVNTLISVLSLHTSVPGVPAALTELHKIAAAPPQPVFELNYTQAPASVALMANTAAKQVREINMVSTDAPIVLGALAFVLLAIGVLLLRRHVVSPVEVAVVQGRFAQTTAEAEVAERKAA